MSYNWGSYSSPTSCLPKIPQGAKSLLAYLDDSFPWVFSLGICNCRNVGGGSSLSHHANCRALDAGIPTGSGGSYIPEFGDPIIELLGPHGRELGLDHLILNRIIYSARSPNGRPYSGVHPHFNHAHIGLTEAGAINLNYATLVAVLGEPAGGDNMAFLPLLDGDGLSRGRPDRREDVYLLQTMLGLTGSGLDGRYGSGTAGLVAPFDPEGGDGKVCGGRTYAAIQGQGGKGEKGDTGATGPRGLKGATGVNGATGAPGPKGDDGKPVTLTLTADTVLP